MASPKYLPQPEPEPVSFSVSVPRELVERFDALQKRTGLTRAAFMRSHIPAGLDAIERELEAASDSEAAG